MVAVAQRQGEGYHPVREAVDVFVHDLPALGGSAVKGFFSLFGGNLPERPLANRGDHDEEGFARSYAARQQTLAQAALAQSVEGLSQEG